MGDDNLKLSRYNILENSDDGYLLIFNTRTGAFASIPPDHSDRVKSALSGEGLTSDPEVISELRNNGFVVNGDLNEFAEIKNAYENHIKDASTLSLTLLASEGCNFDCPYCFIGDKRNIHMTQRIYDSVFTMITNAPRDLKAIELNWFGGEPTLRKRDILSFMRRVTRLCREKEISISSCLITNGYLLTKRSFIEYLKSGIRRYQITLDGDQGTHDRMRFLKNGCGSFARIWKNLLDIKDVSSKFDFNVNIRVNFLDNQDEQIRRLTQQYNEQLSDDPRISIYFRAVYATDNCADGVAGELCKPCDGIDKQLDYYFSVDTSRDRLDDSSQLFAPVPMPKPAWCAAERQNSWIVAADGRLFKCDTCIGNDRYASGVISDDGTFDLVDKRFEWSDSFYEQKFEKCYECKYLPLCQGACARGRAERVLTNACYFNDDRIRRCMQLTHNFYQGKGGASCLSGTGAPAIQLA